MKGAEDWEAILSYIYSLALCLILICPANSCKASVAVILHPVLVHSMVSAREKGSQHGHPQTTHCHHGPVATPFRLKVLELEDLQRK